MTSDDWDLFDTRHVVFKPAKLTPQALEAGYWRAYSEFYKWSSIFRGARAAVGTKERLRHIAYAGGWKKFEPLWDWVIRTKRVTSLLPMLEAVLTGFGSHPTGEVSVEASRITSDRPDHQEVLGGGKHSAELPILQGFSESTAAFSQLSH